MAFLRTRGRAVVIARYLNAAPPVAARVRILVAHCPPTRRRLPSMGLVVRLTPTYRGGILARGRDPEAVVRWAVRAFLHMIFRDGFFHSDPHPGNLLVDDAGRIGIIDFGMNKRLAPAVMTMLRENLLATVTRDPARYAHAFLDAGMIDARDVPAVEEVARISFDPAYWKLPPRDVAPPALGELLRHNSP